MAKSSRAPKERSGQRQDLVRRGESRASGAMMTEDNVGGAEVHWQSYEEVARAIILRIAGELGISHVEPDQSLLGEESGTTWNVEGKLIAQDGGFMILECKCYRGAAIKQEMMGGLAYRIRDTGAAGGIFVTPVPYQAGAKKVAAANSILLFDLPADSNALAYSLRVFHEGKVKGFVGVEVNALLAGSAEVEKGGPDDLGSS